MALQNYNSKTCFEEICSIRREGKCMKLTYSEFKFSMIFIFVESNHLKRKTKDQNTLFQPLQFDKILTRNQISIILKWHQLFEIN